MKTYIVESSDDTGLVVVLQVTAIDAATAYMKVKGYYQKQGWGVPTRIKTHQVKESDEIIHLFTVQPSQKIVAVERSYNYTPDIEYA